MDSFEAQLPENKNRTFLDKVNDDLKEFEKHAAKAVGKKKQEFDELIKKAREYGTQINEVQKRDRQDEFWQQYHEATGRGLEKVLEAHERSLSRKKASYAKYVDDVDALEKWAAAERLKHATDAESGIARAWQNFAKEAKNSAQEMESTFSNLFSGLDSGFRSVFQNFFEHGKLSLDSFKSVFANFLGELMHMAITRPITVQIAGAITGMLGTGGIVQAASAGSVPGGFSAASLPVGSLVPNSCWMGY